MAEKTEIGWCDSTFNPWIGCTKVSPGCDSCYAHADQDLRKHRVKWGQGQPRSRTKTWGDPVKWNKQPFHECPCGKWRGTMADFPEHWECPEYSAHGLRDARRRVFCASLADVFDNAVDPDWRAELFGLIANTPSLDWLLLTKRIGNAAKMLPWMPDGGKNTLMASSAVWPNVWIGATIVNQEEADRDIPKLLQVPARVRFLSMEPLLGPVDLTVPLASRATDGPDHQFSDRLGIEGRLHWVIVGGESGPGARPMNPHWARSLRDQCAAAGVPFHFKQWGEWAPAECVADDDERKLSEVWVARDGTPVGGRAVDFFGGDEVLYRVGKKAAGRLLDGVTHDGYPSAEAQ